MGVTVHSKGYNISGTIPCPKCGHIIDLSDPERGKKDSKPSKKKRRYDLNMIGWSIIIAIVASILLNHFLN